MTQSFTTNSALPQADKTAFEKKLETFLSQSQAHMHRPYQSGVSVRETSNELIHAALPYLKERGIYPIHNLFDTRAVAAVVPDLLLAVKDHANDAQKAYINQTNDEYATQIFFALARQYINHAADATMQFEMRNRKTPEYSSPKELIEKINESCEEKNRQFCETFNVPAGALGGAYFGTFFPEGPEVSKFFPQLQGQEDRFVDYIMSKINDDEVYGLPVKNKDGSWECEYEICVPFPMTLSLDEIVHANYDHLTPNKTDPAITASYQMNR